MLRYLVVALIILGSFSARSAPAQVVWADEFNGDAIDRGTWTFDVGGHGFGNGQLEFDTARSQNAYLENCHLVIEARREPYQGKAFTSARMLTQGRFAFRYGSLEARIKLPDTANGVWPAFWLLGNNFPAIDWPRSGEIDIVEMGSKQGIAENKQRRKINSAVHFADGDNQYDSRTFWHDADVDLSQDFHLYRVDWTPEHLKFYLDEVEIGHFDITPEHLREYHQPAFVLLNVAVGSWGSRYTGVSSPEEVTAPFPAKMKVDWIRLTKNEHTEVFLGKDVAEQGDFYVFRETPSSDNVLRFSEGNDPDFEFGSEAALYLWHNMLAAKDGPTPSEGEQCWAFQINRNDWFGMGVLLPNHRNMSNYSDGYLHFDIKTESPVQMKVGIKSSRGGESFLPLGNDEDEFGFARDNRWQRVTIPLNRFANIDFHTVHQMFMITGEAPSENMMLAIDNVWWEPSAARPKPKGATFGVFTETESRRRDGHFDFSTDGNFFVWENSLDVLEGSPIEGESSLRLASRQGIQWFGCAFTPNTKYDLSHFNTESARLCFSLRTSSDATFMIGMKSGNIEGVGQQWLTFAPGRDPYGFVRDGEWHQIRIPMSVIAEEVDLTSVSQLFQILGTKGPISELEIDDIYFDRGQD